MANWNSPALADTYADFLQMMKDRDTDLATQFEGVSATNLPANAKRWNATSLKWEKWNGTAWVDLAATYGINVAQVGGYTPGNASGNLPISNGTVNTNLNADMLDGRHAGLGPNNLLYLDGSGKVPSGNLPDVGTAGTFRSVTTDAQGRVTGGTNPTTRDGYGITDVPKSDGTGAAGTWSINISGVAASATTAATAAALATPRTINGVTFDGTSNITVADGTKLPLTGGALTGAVTSTGSFRIGGASGGLLAARSGAGSGQATVNTNADEVVVDSAGNGGINILTPSTFYGAVFFGDESSTAAGQIRYNHANDSFTIYTASSLRVTVDSNGVTGEFVGNLTGNADTATSATTATTASAANSLSAGATANSIVNSAWYRTVGNFGWYNETHGGGIHMSDASWVRVYNGKGLFTTGLSRADSGFQVGFEGANFGVSSAGVVTASGYIKSSAQLYGNGGTKGFGKITVTSSTAAPTGGNDGDFHFIY